MSEIEQMIRKLREGTMGLPSGLEFEAAELFERLSEQQKQEPLYVIFDGPPSHKTGRFIEVETADGKGVSVGSWTQCSNACYWKLGPLYASPVAKAQDALDAKRYRWLRSRLFACDADYCKPDGYAVIFEFPSDARIGTTTALDAAIDDAMNKEPK